MKNFRPSLLILFGSAAYLALGIIAALFFNVFVSPLKWWMIVFIPLLSSLLVYGIFYITLKKFIQNRLHIIYKSIQNKQDFTLIKGESIDQLINDAEQEVEIWQKDKNKEITKLKEQELFRRDFLGNLAHELKTPVFATQGYILTLLEGGIDDDEVNRLFLNRAAKATDRIVDILEDLDQITRLEVDELKMDFRSFELIDLIKEIKGTLAFSAKEKNIELAFNKDYNSIYVFADRTKIGQVLTNLIVNSIYYGDVNGKTLISIFTIDDLVTIEIEDNGPGIEERHFPRLFERFYRVEKSRNRNEGGTGLGLAIVKHIIESHKQTINVRSTVGHGSTFSFSLQKSPINGPVSSRGIPLK